MRAVTPRDPSRDVTQPVTHSHATAISTVTQPVTQGHAAPRSRTPLKKGMRVTHDQPQPVTTDKADAATAIFKMRPSTTRQILEISPRYIAIEAGEVG